jgi:hypothetical protein
MRKLRRQLWPRCVTLKREDYSEVDAWIRENPRIFSADFRVIVWNGNFRDYYFQDQQDALIFQLRWS